MLLLSMSRYISVYKHVKIAVQNFQHTFQNSSVEFIYFKINIIDLSSIFAVFPTSIFSVLSWQFMLIEIIQGGWVGGPRSCGSRNLVEGPTNITHGICTATHLFPDTTFLSSTNEVCEGYVFTPVCHSVPRGVSWPMPRGPGPGLGGIGGCVSQHVLRQTPPPADGYCCGRYAFYYNFSTRI